METKEQLLDELAKDMRELYDDVGEEEPVVIDHIEKVLKNIALLRDADVELWRVHAFCRGVRHHVDCVVSMTNLTPFMRLGMEL